MMEPHRPLECREVMDLLYQYLDRELTPAVADAIRAHLAACRHCFALHHFEDAYRRFLAARIRARGAPAPLRRRILDQLFPERDPDAA